MQIDVDPEQAFHVVINGAVTALSLDALAEAYEADAIRDDTLIWQQGLDEWMRLDTLLAALSEQGSEPEEASSAHEPAVDPNSYSVVVAPGEVASVTLEALADAYRLGRIQGETLVCSPGSTQWVPLSVIIASFASQSVGPAPGSTASAPSAHQSSMAAAPVAQVAPVPNMAPASFAAPAPSMAPAASAYSANAAPAPSAPAALGSAPAAYPSAPNSLAPMAASIGPITPALGRTANADWALDDLDLHALQRSRSPWLLRSLMGAGALALGFVIYLGAGASGGEETAQLDGVAAKTVAATAAPAVEAEPSAWEKEQAMLKEADRLDEEAKAQANAFGARLAGDSKEENPAAAPAKRKWQPKAKKKGATASKAGNNEYDPMNGTL